MVSYLLPDTFRCPPEGVSVTFYPGPNDELPDEVEFHSLTYSSNYEAEDRDAEELIDEELEKATPVGIVGVLHPSNCDQVWFFCANHFAPTKGFEIKSSLLSQSEPIFRIWPSLWDARFPCGVDAILPNPNKKQQMYFFRGYDYAYIDTMPGSDKGDYVIRGPSKIVDGWASLQAAQFDVVDAVLENPANKEEAYFFSRTQYVCISWRPDKGDDIIIDGPKAIVDGWASLKAAGFDTVFTMFPNPENLQEAWVFSRDKYVRINVIVDIIVSGPNPVSSHWPALHEAGYY